MRCDRDTRWWPVHPILRGRSDRSQDRLGGLHALSIRGFLDVRNGIRGRSARRDASGWIERLAPVLRSGRNLFCRRKWHKPIALGGWGDRKRDERNSATRDPRREWHIPL